LYTLNLKGCKRQKAEGRRQKAEGRWQMAEGKRRMEEVGNGSWQLANFKNGKNVLGLRSSDYLVTKSIYIIINLKLFKS